jgi:hypothetical protein
VVSERKIFEMLENQNPLLAMTTILNFRSAPKTQIDDCSSIEFLVLIKKTKWLLLTLLGGIRLLTFYLRIFPSETAWPNKAKFYRKHLWKVLYKISSFHLKWTKNMVAIGNSCF